MTVDAKTPAVIPGPSTASGGGKVGLVDLIQGFASAGPLVRQPFRLNGERTFVVSDRGQTVEETRAEIAALLDEAVASCLYNLVAAMRLTDSGDIDLHDVFDPDERELLMKGWGTLRHDRRLRIIERACWCVERQVLLDIDERIMRRRIEVLVARALENAGVGKAA